MDFEIDDILRLVIWLLCIYNCRLAEAEMDNYYNWPESEPPVVKTEVLTAGRGAKLRCQLRERFRHVQKGLNLTWEHKPCRAGHSLGCLKGGAWARLCRPPCPPVLVLPEPRAQDSGLYRCRGTVHSAPVPLSVFMLQFVESRREPPAIEAEPWSNVSAVAPLAASLQCRVRSAVPPTVRWFRRVESNPGSNGSPDFVQYLDSTYQLLNCCSLAVQSSQENVYISKLVISPSSETDSGFYVCLAINDVNFTFREAHINIMPLIKSSGTPDDTVSFLGLFLVPAMFAIVPAVIWSVCFRSRKLKSQQPSSSVMVDQRILHKTACKV